MIYVLDTNIFIAGLNGNAAVLRRLDVSGLLAHSRQEPGWAEEARRTVEDYKKVLDEIVSVDSRVALTDSTSAGK